MACTVLIKECDKVFSEGVLHVTLLDASQLFHANYPNKCALKCAAALPLSIAANICLPGQNCQKLALDVSSFNTQTCQEKRICGIYWLYLNHAHKCQETSLPGWDSRCCFKTNASQQLCVCQRWFIVSSWCMKLKQTVLVIDLLSVWFKSVHMHSRSDRFFVTICTAWNGR